MTVVVPSRDNSGANCDLVERCDEREHIQRCTCDAHDGVCAECGFKITIGPSGREYGHARSTNRGFGSERCDCLHRPESCDPQARNGGGPA